MTTSSSLEELREKLSGILTKEWLLSSNIWCSDKTGKKKETVKFPPQAFMVRPSDKVLDEAMQLLRSHMEAVIDNIVNTGDAIDRDDGSSNAFLNGREYQRFVTKQRAKSYLEGEK